LGPHAGLGVDPLALATLAAAGRSLGMDADLYVDQLYADAPDEGAALLVSNISRYVCDLNRATDDVDPLAVEGGTARSSPHGFVWRTTTEGRPALLGPISRSEHERRATAYHRPYHQALVDLLEERRVRHGYAILLCAHSMPSRGRDGHDDAGVERADVVPGTRGKTTTAMPVIEKVEALARAAGLRLLHDEPYKGGFTTYHYGRPRQGVHSIQIELARRLYMDEKTLEKRPAEFEMLRAFCRTLVRELGSVSL
jgi:N-formylglutamate amidohydrolase